MDLTQLFYLLALGFAVFGFDAAINADTVVTEIHVAPKYSQEGVSREIADTIYTKQLQQIFANESLVRRANVRAATDKSFVSIIGSMLKLEDLTYAFQDLFGMEPVRIVTALTTDGNESRLLVSGVDRYSAPFDVTLIRQPEETTADFLKRGALETAAKLDPYHTALYYLDYFDDSKLVPLSKLLRESIDALPATPKSARRAYFRNLLGITALMDNDKDKAAEQFEAASRDLDNFSAALLNLGFTRVVQGRYPEAVAIVAPVIEGKTLPDGPQIRASAHTIIGVAASAMKQYAEAERHFARAAGINTKGTDLYEYWGLMLEKMGRIEEGREKRRKGAENLASFENYPEIALLFFWMSDEHDQPFQRR